MASKECIQCGKSYLPTGRYQKVCEAAECIRARKNDTARGTPQSRERARTKYVARRAEMDKLKDAPCMDCGNSFPPECMDFDHRPDEEKSFEIGTATLKNWVLILAEIAKCDLICSNCHRIRTKARKLGGRPITRK